jgi:Sodium/calcium exchanger protein
MNKHAPFAPVAARQPSHWRSLSPLTSTLAGLASCILAFAFQGPLFGHLDNYPLTILVFIWLFGLMLWCAFTVMRHADAVAAHLGEPYGTLVLTIAVIIIEVSLITSIILHGENDPTLARDAMFATLMIVLNGMIGTALLMGAALLGTGIQSRRRALPSGGHRLARRVCADPSRFHQDAARSQHLAVPGHSIRRDHDPILRGLSRHSDHAASGFLRSADQRQ